MEGCALAQCEVDLVEFLEHLVPLFGRDARPGIADRDGEGAVPEACHDADLSLIRELDGVADEVEQHLRQPLLVAEAMRQALGDLDLKRKLLARGE